MPDTDHLPCLHVADRYRSKDEALLRQPADERHPLGDQVGACASDIGTTLREHHYTTVTVAAGLAFAIGALWKMGRPRKQLQLEALLARLPDLSSRDGCGCEQEADYSATVRAAAAA
jgi:hypothetical protein